MKRYLGLAICILLWIMTVSCSAVFTAGVSGQILEYDGKTGFKNVTVYVYGSDEDRLRDYNGFISRTSNVDFNGNFIPSEDLYVPRATTDDSGKFEISKIVWSTTKPMFGKTDDIHNVYLMFYNENISITPLDSEQRLIKWPESCKIVSSSSNPYIVKLNLCCKSKYFGGISGYIRDTSAGTGFGLGEVEDDMNTLILHYCDASCVGRDDEGGVRFTWKSGLEENKKSASKSTEAAPYTQTGDILSHGNFANLGRDAKFEFIFDSTDEALFNTEDGYVYFCIELIRGLSRYYSEPIKVYSSDFGAVYNAKLSSLSTGAEPPELRSF